MQANAPMVHQVMYADCGSKNITTNFETVTKDIYDSYERAIEQTKGAISTTYGSDIVGQLQKILQKFQTTNEQSETLYNLVFELIDFGRLNHQPINVKIDEATDEEVLISRTTNDGVSFISVNPYGDILVNFSGYVKPKKSKFFYHPNLDAETIVYTFLDI